MFLFIYYGAFTLIQVDKVSEGKRKREREQEGKWDNNKPRERRIIRLREM